jgi:hypothetical protein
VLLASVKWQQQGALGAAASITTLANCAWSLSAPPAASRPFQLLSASTAAGSCKMMCAQTAVASACAGLSALHATQWAAQTAQLLSRCACSLMGGGPGMSGMVQVVPKMRGGGWESHSSLLLDHSSSHSRVAVLCNRTGMTLLAPTPLWDRHALCTRATRRCKHNASIPGSSKAATHPLQAPHSSVTQLFALSPMPPPSRTRVLLQCPPGWCQHCASGCPL